MKALRTIISILALSLFTGQAQAQFVVKRVKCADAANLDFVERYPRVRHENTSSVSKQLSVQLTKDGCRPRLSGGFWLEVRNWNDAFVGSAALGRLINGRATSTALRTIDDSQSAHIVFFPSPTDARVSGTFDYMYSWE